MKKRYIPTIPILFAALLFAGCNKVLDKQNLTAVNPSEVWSNAAIADAYLNNIYSNLMPGNPYGSGNGTDEGVAYQLQTNNWLRGTATFDSYDIFDGNYTQIRAINILLSNIDQASFGESDKKVIRGQGLFWRAWAYNTLVSAYGGVPLVLAPQSPLNFDSLYLPRNTTTECVTQIVKDLDDAIALLPDSWSGNDVGRIDKGVAMAFKGRVLLFFASPLFNPSGDQAKWQAAYDANLAAKNFLDGQSKGLYGDYSKIWDDELNKEVVMVRRYHYPEATYFQGGLRPLRYSKDDVGYDRPSLELVNAFPMRDGSAWNATPRSYDTLFRNRDDRFYATVYYNGDPIQYIADMVSLNEYMWTYFVNGAHNSVTYEDLYTNSSFYRIKAIDKTLTKGTVYNAGVDWPEIRYAEVLMNLGEAANEINKPSEALNALYAIRQRANIEPGAGSTYGITAVSQDDIRQAYINERFVEFAFENKRWNDLRRWKRFDILNGLPQRHGLDIELKAGQTDVSPLDNINTVWTKFTSVAVTTDAQNLDVKDQYYIYGIPKARLDRNPKLKQNNNWGGDFDPLQ